VIKNYKRRFPTTSQQGVINPEDLDL